MANQNVAHPLMERVLSLLRVMDEHPAGTNQLNSDRLAEFVSGPDDGELRSALEELRFADELPSGFFIYRADRDENILYVNRALLNIFQCENPEEFRELTGNTFNGMVHPDDLNAVKNSIQIQIADQNDFDYVEYRIRRKDGSICWVEDYGHIVRRSPGQDVFYVFLREHHFSAALQKANQAVQARNAFLSQISHEMRTPLNAIFGFTTLAKTSLQEPDAVEEYLNQIKVASHQMLDMVTQALDAAATSSMEDVAQDECNIADIVQEVYDFLLPQANEKSIFFALNHNKITHRIVYTDRKRFKQMVLNLANNALTYTDAGGRVDIVLTEVQALPDNHAIFHLEVQDTGIGIKKELLNEVFEPFSRETPSTLGGVRGIGLGLTIIKNIVEMLDGVIDVKTTPGQGSVFTVTLPLQVQPLPDVSSQRSTARHSLHILLAEDNELNQEIEVELLKRMGFIVDPVADGRAALEKVERSSPGDYDILILDLQMPVMDGWQVAAAIRELPDPHISRVPIIALSANVGINSRRQSMESGIDVHLPKPMDVNVLLETIEKFAENHRL